MTTDKHTGEDSEEMEPHRYEVDDTRPAASAPPAALKMEKSDQEAPTRIGGDSSSSPSNPKTNEETLLGDVKKVNDEMEDLFLGNRENNFTWEHFFVTHCGILKEDALVYEKNLIAHRLSPQDTLVESLSLLIELGRIPLGDKIKIMKTLARQEEILNATEEKMKSATSKIGHGLEKYNEFEARIIIGLGGGTSEWEIDYGIELYEEGKAEMEKLAAASMLKDPKCKEGYLEGALAGRKFNDPAMKLLRSFGYITFDYTRNKEVPAAISGPTSSNLVVDDLIFGNGNQGAAADNIPAQLGMLMIGT